jgi:hypothetical protein
MTTIYQRKSKHEKRILGWKAAVRIEEHPAVCRIRDRKKVVEDWAKEAELQIKEGTFNFGRVKRKQTCVHLLTHYISSGGLVLNHPSATFISHSLANEKYAHKFH